MIKKNLENFTTFEARFQSNFSVSKFSNQFSTSSSLL